MPPNIKRTSPNIIVPKNKIIKPEDVTLDDLKYLSKESFAMWSLTSGVKVDGYDVAFNDRRYLLPIYMNNERVVVWQKAAQMGATIYMLLRMIWWLTNNQGRKAGLYFPTRDGVDNLSKDRLTPLLGSIEALRDLWNPEDKLGLRTIGKSSLYLLHLGGKASKDSTPLDFIAFDEVRLVDGKDVDQAKERISASPHKFEIYMSTAGLQDADINLRYQRGTQHSWLSACGCSDGVDLARTFPDCVVDDPKRGLYLRCPKCKWTIKDPQNGRYVPYNSGADYTSYHVSQLVSKHISLKEIWQMYSNTTNKTEFHNAKLGIPFIDEANRGVGIGMLRACVDDSIAWQEPNKKDANYTAMGVDQGAGYNMVTIMGWKDGKRVLKHVEIIESSNPEYYVAGKPVTPFHRLGELMEEFKVKLCVIDAMPNANEAINFANQFRGRVFVAWYMRDAKDPVAWGDRKKTAPSIAKAGALMKMKHKVILSRYLSLSMMLGLWRDNEIVCPEPSKLVQVCRDEKTNQLQPEATCERLFSHLCRLIRREKVVDEETGETKYEWIYTGGDPHLAHSLNYCVAALDRVGRGVSWAFV